MSSFHDLFAFIIGVFGVTDLNILKKVLCIAFNMIDLTIPKKVRWLPRMTTIFLLLVFHLSN